MVLNIDKKRSQLINKFSNINIQCVLQDDKESNSIGVSFEYLSTMYTIYIDADTENGDLIKHDKNNITTIENMGSTSANDLIIFFNELPDINKILK